MTETREQVVARVTAAVDGAADGAFGFDRPNPVTDPGTLAVEHVWCAGRRVSCAGRAGRFDRTVRPLDCLQRCRIVKQET